MPSPDASLDDAVYSVVGDRYTFLLTGADTGGACAVFEALVPPGCGPPPHIHHREDEGFYVIEGDFEFTVAGEPIRLSAGGFLFGRRGVSHQFKNVGTTPGKMIFTITPAGLEEFFFEIGRRLPGRQADPIPPLPEDIEKLIRTAPKYGLELVVEH